MLTFMDTLERASATVKSHIEQQNDGYGSWRRQVSMRMCVWYRGVFEWVVTWGYV